MKSKEALNKIGATTYYDWSNIPLSEHFKEEFEMIKKSLDELHAVKCENGKLKKELEERKSANYNSFQDGWEMCKIEYHIEELKKRDIAIKPIQDGNIKSDYICPICGELVFDGVYLGQENYCGKCGQHLDWSEE